MSKSSLGRGILELIADGRADDEHLSGAIPKHGKPATVSVSLLYPGIFQPRQIFDEEALQELAVSIKENGIIQPIVVRQLPYRNGYEIIAGERRWRASIIAKLEEVPIIIKDLSDKQCLEYSIIENIQRQDLTAIEESEGYRKLIEEFSYRHEDVARIMGKSRSHITNMLRVLTLPDNIKDMLNKRQISLGHARALVGAHDIDDLATEIVTKGLNVRDTESLVKSRSPSTQEERFAALNAIEKELSKHLNVSVKISVNRNNTGKLLVSFESLSFLDALLEKLNKL